MSYFLTKVRAQNKKSMHSPPQPFLAPRPRDATGRVSPRAQRACGGWAGGRGIFAARLRCGPLNWDEIPTKSLLRGPRRGPHAAVHRRGGSLSARHRAQDRSAELQRATRTTTKEINRQIVLNLVREYQPISRADLARRMEVARAIVSPLVNELIEAGLIYEGAPGASGGAASPRCCTCARTTGWPWPSTCGAARRT